MHIGGALRRQRAGVRTMHLAEILAATEMSTGLSRGGARDAARRPAAPQPRQGDADDPRQAARASASWTTGRRCATRARRSRRARWRRCPSSSSAWRRRSRAPAGRCTGRATAAEANAIVARRRARPTAREEVIKVKSLATDEIDLNEGLEARGRARDRDRPGGADRPARRRPAVAHPRARDPPEPRRDPRAVRAHDRRRAGPRLGGDGDRRGGAHAPAREVPLRAGGGQRRELRRRRDRHGRASSSPRATGACARRCPRCS